MDRKLSIATWNIAAINNNPFEYWITFPDEIYNKFMFGVEQFLSMPSEDFRVNTAFTEAMFSELLDLLEDCKFAGLERLKSRWIEDLSQRRAITDFLKDKSIGDKRLTSMPDRTTNTILLSDGSRIMRPSVINAYDGCLLTSAEVWWTEWNSTQKRMINRILVVYTRLSSPFVEPSTRQLHLKKRLWARRCRFYVWLSLTRYLFILSIGLRRQLGKTLEDKYVNR